MEKRLESILTDLLATETEAKRIIGEAEKTVREIREQTKVEVQKILDEAKLQGEQKVQQALEEARKQSEIKKSEVIESAKKEAEHWEELFKQNREKAINFVIESAISVQH